MPSLLLVCLLVSFFLVGGCSDRGRMMAARDACSLISKEEIESVQGTPVNETKSSQRSDNSFRVAQCFYTTAEFSKSVNLALVEKRPGQPDNRSPRDFWKKKFGPYSENQKERRERAERDHEVEPKKIAGLGDDAYWVSNRFGGMLYVLKGDAFISVGLGGTDDEDTKLTKSKVLARKALQRL